MQGNHPRAIEAFREALTYDPKLAAAEFGLGSSLLNLGDAPAAAEGLRACGSAGSKHARNLLRPWPRIPEDGAAGARAAGVRARHRARACRARRPATREASAMSLRAAIAFMAAAVALVGVSAAADDTRTSSVAVRDARGHVPGRDRLGRASRVSSTLRRVREKLHHRRNRLRRRVLGLRQRRPRRPVLRERFDVRLPPSRRSGLGPQPCFATKGRHLRRTSPRNAASRTSAGARASASETSTTMASKIFT